MDQNRKTADSFNQLTKRVSVIENNSDFSGPINNLPRPKHKSANEADTVLVPSKTIKCVIFSSAKPSDLGVEPVNVPRSQNAFPLPSSSGLKALKEKEFSSGPNEGNPAW